MLLNTWYVAAESREVTNRPKKVKMLGQDFVLFRDEAGHPACLSDTCVHRGGSLSGGKVRKGCIECPYHGWQFKGDGRCTKVPAQSAERPIPKKARVDAYPVKERYGWVWVYLGDEVEDERPSLPEVPELDEYRTVQGQFLWNANYVRVVENALDPAHAAFVHGDSFGNPENPLIPDYNVVSTPWGATTTFELERPPLKGVWNLFGSRERPNVRVTNDFHMSGMSVVLKQIINPKMQLCLFDANTPIDEKTTRTFWTIGRSFFKGAWADGDSRRRTLKIFKQDQVIVEAIRPILPPARAGEISIKADGMPIAFRKKRAEWLRRGWGIDVAKWRREDNDSHVTTIGCPSRKSQPKEHWTLRNVPTIISKSA